MRKLINEKWGSIFLRLSLWLALWGTGASVKSAEHTGDATARPAAQANLLCTYALDPTNAVFDYPAADGVIAVTAPVGCDWTVDVPYDWIQIHFFTNGSGNGTVRYTVYENANPIDRTGTITVGGQVFTIYQLAGPCVYSILPTNDFIASGAASGKITVFTQDGCSWTTLNTNRWITITNGASGLGNAVVSYTVSPSYSPTDRTGVVMVAGRPFKLTQLGTSCRYTLSPASQSIGSGGGTTAAIVGTTAACFWDVFTTNAWITPLSATSGTGTQSVSYTVSPNPSSISRTGVLSIAGLPLTVTQGGAPCTYSLAPTSRTHSAGVETGSVSVTSIIGCTWTVQNTNNWITVISGSPGVGSGTFSYQTAANPGGARTGNLVVAGVTFSISQGAATPPVLTSQPASKGVRGGAAVSFSVSATGTAPLSYQWRLNGTNLVDGPFVSGSASPTLTLPSVQGWQAGSYSVVVSNVRGSVTSAPPAVLTLDSAPVAVSQPQSLTVGTGANATFSFGVAGTAPFFHQWYFNNLPLASATSATLTLTAVGTSQGGPYFDIVTNALGSLTSAVAVLTVNPAGFNTAPVLAAIGNKTAVRSNLLTFTVSATDSDLPAQTLTYSLDPGAPSGASINPTTGVFAWIAAATQVPSTTNVTIRVTDSGSPPLSASKTVTITIVAGVTTNLNLVPTNSVWKYRDTGQDLGTTWTGLTYNDSLWASGPAILGYLGGSEATVVSYGPDSTLKYITTYFRRAITVANPSAVGPLTVQVRRDDGVVVYLNGVEVYRDNMPTGAINYLTAAPLSVAGTNKTSYHVSAAISPSLLVAGTNIVAAEVHQHSGSSTSMDFDLGLTATGTTTPNTAPVLAPIGNKTVLRSNLLTFAVSATDADVPSQTLTYSLDAGAPSGASINPTTGVFTWTPTSLNSQAPSTNLVTVRVTDNGSPTLSDFATITINVTLPTGQVNTSPVLAAIGNKTVLRTNLLTFTASATDTNVPAQTLTYSLDAGAPTGATINPASGVFTWTPSLAQAPSTNLVTVRVTDNGSPPLSDFETITINVTAPAGPTNTAPVLAAIGDKTVLRTNLLTFTASATDTNVPAQTLTYSLDAGAPTGASINPSNGVFTWTPSLSQAPSTNTVTVRVTDNGSPSLSDFETIRITVTMPAGPSNSPPVLAAIGNKTVLRSNVVTFTASATDTNVPAQTLTYTLDPGAPSGAAINPTTGVFTWTAVPPQVPSANNVTVRVTDNGSPPLSDAKTFTITVVAGGTTNLTLVSTGAVWKYRDTGQDLGTTWTGLTYNDSVWASGPAMLGYGGNGEATVVSYGPDSTAKYITTYFRRAFTVSDLSLLTALSVQVRRDDGVVVYLNGAEVFRDNIPTGTINYLTVATTNTSGTDRTSYHISPTFSPGLLVLGTNVVAAEVHQRTGSSTSMDFDLGLTATVIKADNTPPVLATIGSKTVYRGDLLTFTASATDVDLPAQTLTYSLDAGAPAGASINPTTGVFTWTPTNPQVLGTNFVNVRVTDNGSPSSSTFERVTILVRDVITLAFIAGNTNGASGAQVVLPVQVNRFTNISSFQFSVHWDATAAAFMSLEQLGLVGMGFGMDATNNGTVTVSWDDMSGLSQTLTNGATLFAMRFQLTPQFGAATTVRVDGVPTPIEAADDSLRLVPVSAVAGQISNTGTNSPAIIQAAPLRLLGLALDAGGSVSMSWTASPGKTYRVQYTTDLSSEYWSDLGDPIVSGGSSASLTDAPGIFEQRFYRVLELP